MSQKCVCENCGANLPNNAVEGLCPMCLLGTAIELAPAGGPPTNPQPSVEDHSPEPASSAAITAATRRFGDYELLEGIASGGMGVVYKARQVSLNRLVAVKTLPFGKFTRDTFIKRFRAEAEAAAKLKHPNIVAIHEVGEHEGQPYFSMDYVEGSNLADVARDQPLPIQRAVRFVRTIAEAVHYAHGMGILHRDLKPSNILIDQLDEPHITDFGLAKDLRGEGDLTLTGQTLGSPNYIPPEQIDGKRGTAIPQSDVYSLGAMLYHLLTGRPPFVGDSLTATLQQVAAVDPVAPRLLNPSLPRDLETICLKCLEKDSTKRYSTAQELADELSRWQVGEPIRARPIKLTERGWRWCRRKPALASSLLAAVVLLLILAIGGPVASIRINAARAKAQLILERQRVQLAEEHFSRNETSQGIGYLAQVLRDNPKQWLAAQRLMSALTYRHFPLPITPPLPHGAAILDAQFSPDGDLVVTSSADGTAQLWNARAGERVGSPLVHPVFAPGPFSNRVWAVAFSPDGRRIATASANSAARLWDGRTGAAQSDWLLHGTGGTGIATNGDAFVPGAAVRKAIKRMIPGRYGGEKTITESRGVTGVCFSPDGTRLVTTGDDGLARIWDISTARPLLSLVHGGLVSTAQFSRDGRLLATTCWDTSAYIWESATGRQLAQLPHDARVHTADFSPDGEWLVTGERLRRAWIWRRQGEAWRLTNELKLSGEVFWARFTPDGERIVIASSGRQVQIYEAGTGRLVHQHTEIAGVNGGDLSPDGRWFAVATAGEDARIYDARSGDQVSEPLRADASITVCRFSPERGRLITGASDGVAQVWSLERQPRSEKLEHAFNWLVRRAFYSDDGALLCTLGVSEFAVLWNLHTGRPLYRLQHQGALNSACFSRDGRWVALASDDRSARVWSTKDGTPVSPPLMHSGDVIDLQFSRDGHLLLTASSDHSARLWDTQSFKTVQSFAHQNDVRTAKFSPDERHIVTASDDFTAVVWDAASGQRVTPPLRHSDEVLWAEFSPDGSLIATASRDSSARIWDSKTGQPVTAPLKHRSVVRFARFDPSGRVLATASEDRTVQLWKARTGVPLTEPLVHDEVVGGLVFGPSGSWIASSAANGPARFWEVETGQPLSESLPGADVSIALARDGSSMATTSGTGHTRVWETPGAPVPMPGWMLDLAEAIAGQRRMASGIVRTEPGELHRLRALHQLRGQGGYYERWARWFFADPAHRKLTPGSNLTTDEYTALLVENGSYESLDEAADLSPTNQVIVAKLAELEAAQTPPKSAEADFHLDRALKLAPDDSRVLDVRKRVRTLLGR